MGLLHGVGLFVSHNMVLTASFVLIVVGALGLSSYLKNS